MAFGVFGIHEEVSLFMITNPIRHPLPFTLKTLCFIHPFWTNCSYPSECDDMKTWLISVLLMLITVPSVVKRRRNGTRLSLNWPRHIKPASLLWQSYNIGQSLNRLEICQKIYTTEDFRVKKFRHLLNRDKKCVNALNWDKTSKITQ